MAQKARDSDSLQINQLHSDPLREGRSDADGLL